MRCAAGLVGVVVCVCLCVCVFVGGCACECVCLCTMGKLAKIPNVVSSDAAFH